MMQWSRLDRNNVTCDCARHMKLTGKTQYSAMICKMSYCVTTPEKGFTIKPFHQWDRINTDYKFEVMVRTDSDYVKCLDMERSMTGSVMYLNGAPVTYRTSTWKMVRLSMTEAELNSEMMHMQDALLVRNILKSLGLKVKLPMSVNIDNGVAMDIGDNWSIG